MKKLLSLALLIGVSHNASGMEKSGSLGAAEGLHLAIPSTVKNLPANSYIFSRDFKSDDFELDIDFIDSKFNREAKALFVNTYHTSCYIRTNEDGKIARVHLSPIAHAIHTILKTKYTEKLTDLRALKKNCIQNHDNYQEICDARDRFLQQAKTAQATLDARTWQQRFPKFNTFISFGLGTGFATGIMAALCWNSSFETKFTVLKQYLGFMTKAAASVPTNVA